MITLGLGLARKIHSRDWLELLERHDVQYAVLHRRRDGRLIPALLASSKWSLQFINAETAILARCRDDEQDRKIRDE